MMEAVTVSDPFSLFQFAISKGMDGSINYTIFDNCKEEIFNEASSRSWVNSMKLLLKPAFSNKEVDSILEGLNNDFKTKAVNHSVAGFLKYKNSFNLLIENNKKEEDPFMIESTGIATNSSYIGCIAKELELVEGPTDRKYCSNLKIKYPNTTFKANCIDCKKCIKEMIEILEEE